MGGEGNDTDLIDAKSEYETLLNAYEGQVVHGSPTLDEAYYHFGPDKASQDSRRHRNKDQVVTKTLSAKQNQEPQVNPEQRREGQRQWPLLRVNQLWIWIIDNGALKVPSLFLPACIMLTLFIEKLITSTSHPVDKTEDSFLKGVLSYLGNKAEAGERQAQPRSASEMSKVLVDYCIGFFEQERVAKEDKSEIEPSIRQIFSDAINQIVCNKSIYS